MIDFHCHILPSIDDGAISIDESIAMAKALSEFGYKTVCCTPHCIKGFYDISPQKVREATLMLQADFDNADIVLDLWPGMEYMLDQYFCAFADDLLPLGETNLVLCEAPPQANPDHVLAGLALIIEKGFVPLIAHPERTQFFYERLVRQDGEQATRNVECLEKPGSILKKLWPFAHRKESTAVKNINMPTSRDQSFKFLRDCLFLANLGSFTGYYGPKVQACAYELLKINSYSGITSDLHDSASATKVLLRDKFEINPWLKRLAEFDGRVSQTNKIGS